MTGRWADVLVVGGGPAGRALAGECGKRGLDTVLVDPAPDRPWPATYGSWSAELPASLPSSVVAARADGRAVALTGHRLGWEYAVLDVRVLRAHLDAALDGVRIHTGRVVTAVQASGSSAVELADGSVRHARVVVDAGGHRQPLHRAVRTRVAAEQTAYGVVVDEKLAAPLVAPGAALFMDWRADHGESGMPTFLYAVPLGSGRVLLEETSLARRPGLALPVLRRRLFARLARHGVVVPPDAPVEKVVFPLDRPKHRAAGSATLGYCGLGFGGLGYCGLGFGGLGFGGLGFGAAAPLVHPASGFSLASSLQLAPAVATAFAAHLPRDPQAARAAATAVIWPPAARAVHRFRRIGLEALLRMPPDDVAAFFEVFFALPERHRWSYLTGRSDLPGTAATMATLFARSSWTLRRRLVLPALQPPARASPYRR